MRMQYFEVRKSRIELIPMIDVMFFLLVFFVIISLHMIPNHGLGVKLPSSTVSDPLKVPKVMITISSEGALSVNGVAMTRAALFQTLSSGTGQKPDVTIAASRSVAFSRFVAVMDACRKAGVTAIGIATAPGSGK